MQSRLSIRLLQLTTYRTTSPSSLVWITTNIHCGSRYSRITQNLIACFVISSNPKADARKPPVTDDEKELWETLGATVLQWIYSTFTTNNLETIVEGETTAIDTWNRLADIFQDNDKNSRALTLEQEFSHIVMEDFPSASAYCQRLKSLVDHLKNVSSNVSNSRLVLQLVFGLTDAYHGGGTIIRQSDPYGFK
ncbi:uncharacterized protein LOC141614740 [Silene latifolia]|uniref:uncharacterized protein LOC141614740 n=1 Tax=Silene latifolia TaxID=37657 RepID=UPI003D78453B